MDRELVNKALGVCKRNEKLFKDLGIHDFDHIYTDVKKLAYATKLQEEYGLTNITRDMVYYNEPDVYVRINEHMCIASMGAKYNRKISCSADGRQPKDEVMLVIEFPTGSYIFGQDYPVELFKEMWDEIKTYDFKFGDDFNHNLYFPLDKASSIANALPEILKKYHKKHRDGADARRAVELRKELEKLEGKQNG